ncbi:MAG: wax ester/triacylglycerol synthase family O-acyltransferase [Acidimicrobiia bacterium]|nr:wax ester/triacylglycerol synthase family O-acyltransferase [Acidimicrobiia bacterium]
MATTASLNPVDATLWAIRRDPELRTTIVALALLDRVPEWDRLRRVIEQATDRIPRLRQRVVEPSMGLGRPHWEETDLDLDYHLRRTAAAEPGLRSVLDLCGALATEDFDDARPLWEVVLVEGLDDERAALVLKISHTLTDGVGGVGLLRLLDDDTPVGDAAPPEPAVEPDGPEHSHLLSVPTGLVSAAMHAGLHPLDTMGEATSVLGSAGRLLRPAGAPLSTLMTDRSLRRWVGVSELPLERLREAAHRADGSINDAFVTIALGALWDYHDAIGVEGARFRVTMPVSFRRDGDDDGGNQWTPARVVLDVDGHGHPFTELTRHQAVLRSAVDEPANSFTQTISAGVQQLPAGLTAGIVAGMVKGSDLVLTDVPGLGEGLTIAGARVTRLHPFAPTGGAAVNIGLMSHGGTACIGFTMDRAAMPQPELLVRCFEERADDFMRRRRLDEPAVVAPPTPPADEPAPSTPHERLSALDTSFLRMETPTTPMHMGVLCVLDGAPLRRRDGSLDLDRLRTHIADRARQAPRLTKRVEEVPFELGRPVWVDDDTAALDSHVWTSTLPAPGGRTELLERCEELQMQCLDRTRPLFDMHFIDGLDPDEFGPNAVALVQRVHHALLDGVSGVELLAVLFDAEPDPAEPSAPAAVAPSTTGDRPGPFQLLTEAAADLIAEPGALIRAAIDALRSPLRTTRRLVATAAAMGDFLGGGAAPSLNQPVGHHRRLLALTVPLERVHDTGVELGGTVNDVVLSAVTRGLRSLLASRHETVAGPLRALVPVSTRHSGMDGEHGNHVAALVVELPIDVEDPIGTFVAVSTRTRDLKNHHHADGTEVMMDASNHLPPVALDLVSRLMGQQHAVNIVVTNLPGPPTPLYLLGGEIRELVPIVPLGANLTVGVAVLSYGPDLTLAFHADREACADLEVLVDGTGQAFDALADLAGL